MPYLQASIHTSFYIIVMMKISLFWTFLDVSSRKTRFSGVNMYFQLLSFSCVLFPGFVREISEGEAEDLEELQIASIERIICSVARGECSVHGRTAWMRFNVPSHACGDPFLCRRWVLGASGLIHGWNREHSGSTKSMQFFTQIHGKPRPQRF